MDSGEATRALPRVGCPIRKSRHHRLVSISTGLIAAAHVLHRLSAPRHPPCALVLLIEKNTCVAAMEFSRCARASVAHIHALRCQTSVWLRRTLINRVATVSQNSTAWKRRGRRCSRRPGIPDDPRPKPETIDGPGTYRSKSSGFPRKEVIQPQLPLRLPCYDFTPVTDPTFDGSLPCGLGHRLRVLPASVV
jgi:hypothetical protein